MLAIIAIGTSIMGNCADTASPGSYSSARWRAATARDTFPGSSLHIAGKRPITRDNTLLIYIYLTN